MKRIVAILLTAFICSISSAQPDSWAKKAAKSLFTMKTFDDKGGLLGSGNGFFVGETGEAVGDFAPFNGAARAIIIDAAGKEYNIDYIVGASEVYDVAKFHVNIKRSLPLTISSTGATNETTLWLLPYAQKTPKCVEGTVVKVETVDNGFDYYTLTLTAPENVVGCPVLNANGEVVGMMQGGGSADKQYAVGVRMAVDMKASGLSFNDPTLRLTKIKKSLPDVATDALVALYVGVSTLDSLSMNELVDDFITKFPKSVDGYVYRANRAFLANDFASADKDMQTAVREGDIVDDAHFNYAKMILDKNIHFPAVPFESWTLDKALAEIDAAIEISHQKLHRQLRAQILFAQKKYDESEAVYKALVGEGEVSAENYYGIARCREMQNDTTACIAMLDSAVATFSRPYLKEAAPYIMARAQMLIEAGQYRKAVNDLNDYEQLMVAYVNDNFYYIRSQAEVNGRLYKQALDDLKKAVQMSPGNTFYLAEKASLELRVGLNDDAIATAKECISVDSKLSDGYLFLGVAQCAKGEKAEGLKNLAKAKELGDTQAQTFIDKYSK
ncbi:MAG: hypothetical protein ACI4B3_07375 [Prevotella sp.]